MHQTLFNIITIIGHFVPLWLIVGLRHHNQLREGYFIGVAFTRSGQWRFFHF